ncbi:amidohydrolase family protein [Candidatus Bathyarchaeota archaeon]|nr:amidohydrolase family protein [Candidatus Bathyarchaeota archaeon]
MVDILIENGILVSMNPSRELIEDGAIAVDGDTILEIGLTDDLSGKYDADKIIDASNMVVMPGLFDGHAHAGHSLLKSLGVHNGTWYEACELIYSQASDIDFWKADALLTNLERLKSGTTCGVSFLGGGDSVMRVDDPNFAEAHCDAAEMIGVRTFLAVGPRRPPYPRKYSRWSGDSRRDYMVEFDEMMDNTRTIINKNNGRSNGRINIAVMFPTPHPEVKPITGVVLEDLKRQASEVYQMSRENYLMFTQDGHTRGTVKFCVEKLGILGSNSLLSHSTELTAEEIKICKDMEISIAHNPSAVASILKRCPVPELIDAGVKVALGSDAAGPDRSYDMFRHMFQAMRYHRRYYRDARVLPPGKVLEMCTIDAAKAFGIGDYTGSLEKGKKADIILVDMRKPHLQPQNMPVDRLTYFANGSDVDTVIVDGQVLMENRVVKHIDEEQILDLANEQIELAIQRSGLDKLFELTENYWGHSRY